jgi:hypothetical protein
MLGRERKPPDFAEKAERRARLAVAYHGAHKHSAGVRVRGDMVGVIGDAKLPVLGLEHENGFPRRVHVLPDRELAYSADAARKPAINRMKVTAHQRTSLGMADIIGYTHRAFTRHPL